jgi:hypothetical protein
MTRRELLIAMAAGMAIGPRPMRGHAQAITPKTIDPDFVRMWNDAQAARPPLLGPRARIARPEEPGTALTVRGQLFAADGSTPLAHAVVFAYQTDQSGMYDLTGGRGWRLKAWARTDDQGRFTLDTIHPGPYPGRSIAAHIHMGLDGAVGRRQTLEDVLFEGDRLLTKSQKQRSREAGRFANIVRVNSRHNREECDIIFRLTGEYVF